MDSVGLEMGRKLCLPTPAASLPSVTPSTSKQENIYSPDTYRSTSSILQ